MSPDEIELMGELKKLLGDSEMSSNGGMWRLRIRDDRVAMREAIGELKLRMAGRGFYVANKGAWLTKSFRKISRERESLRTTPRPRHYREPSAVACRGCRLDTARSLSK